jgi:VWFA-related protein
MTGRLGDGARGWVGACASIGALAMLCGLGPVIVAQEPVPQPAPQPAPLFRTRAEVVRVDALVTSRGRPINGLTAADFELYDNGVRQEVTLASIEDLEVDVVLALDVSASVRGPMLQTLRQAAGALVRELRPADRAAVLTFASGVTIAAPLTTDHTGVARALEQVEGRGATTLVDAAWSAVLLTRGTDRPTLLLVFSDGIDTASWLSPVPVLALASRSNLVADGVVVGGTRESSGRRETPPERPAGEPVLGDAGVEDFLPELTRVTGGRMVDGGGGSRLAAAFAAALKGFRERYQLSYTPTNVDQPGWHRVEVRVKRTDATVRARPGYTR